MAGINQKWEFGPPTREVSVAVKGGQLLMADGTTGKVKPSTAAALTVVGVASQDAEPAVDPAFTTGYGAPGIDISRPRDHTTVLRGYVPVTYLAAANFGQKLIAAANGQVTVAGVTPDAATVVGRCEEPAGVAAGAVGIALIY